MNDEWSVLSHGLFTLGEGGWGRRIPVTIKQEAGFGEEAKLLHLLFCDVGTKIINSV